MKRAQFSMEFLFAISIIILLFITVLAFSYERYKEIEEMKGDLDIYAECGRISNIISSLYIMGDGSEYYTKINYNSTVYNNSEIIVEPKNISCFYIGKIQNNTKLTKQTIKIKNSQNQIIIEND